MTSPDLIRKLEKEGFYQSNKGKRVRHLKFRHSDGRTTMVSKGRGEIPNGTLKEIERQTKLKLT